MKVKFQIYEMICMFLLILAFAINVVAQPRKLLGEDGALIWVEGDYHNLGIYGIEGGERAMLFFSAARAEDSRHIVFHQIYSLDGNREFENPRPISNTDMAASHGRGDVDANGDFYIGYYAAPPENLTDVHLYVHKYDSNGNALWGDGLVHRTEIDTGNGGDVNETPDTEYIIPDGRGGCYHGSKFGIYAIGDDGQLRDWEWQGELSEEFDGRHFYKPILDGEGGLWMKYRDDDVEEYFWQHIRYDGSLAFDGYQRLRPDGLDGNPDVAVSIGWNGGAICKYNRGSMCVIDDEGRLLSEDHQFFFGDRWSIGSYQLEDGSLILSLNYTEYEDTLRNNTFRVTKYNPETNEFAWDQNGVELENANSMLHKPVEIPDGNIQFLLSGFSDDEIITFDLVTLDQDGNIESSNSIEYVAHGSSISKQFTPAVDGGFWYYGYQLSYYRWSPVHTLSWFDAEAQLGIEDYIHTVLPNRDYLNRPTLWIDPEGNYRSINSMRDGFRLTVFDEQGNALTPPEGEHIPEANRGISRDLLGKKLGNSVYYIWRTGTRGLAKLASFDLEGNYEWTTELEVDPGYISAPFILEYITESQSLLVEILSVNTIDRFSNSYTPHLFNIDVDNGDIVWRWNQPGLESGRELDPGIVTRFVTYSDEYIYHSFYAQGYLLRVHKLSLEGETVWRRPVSMELDLSTVSCGIVPAAGGGVYIGIYHDYVDSVTTWLREISPEGELEDSLNFYNGFTHTNMRNFELLRSQDNIWLVNNGYRFNRSDTLGVVQGIREDGTRLIWVDEGYRPAPQDGRIARITGGVSDGAGGLWLLYYYPSFYSHYGAPYAIWIDPQPGYPRHPVKIVDNPIKAKLSGCFAMDNGDLVTISSHCSETFRRYSNTYAYRLQRIRHPEELSSTDNASVPEKFALKAAYPNPFNSMTLISYSVPVASHISLKLYNLAGREVRTLTDEMQKAGNHQVILNADQLASGLYFVRMEAAEKVFTRKLVLIK